MTLASALRIVLVIGLTLGSMPLPDRAAFAAAQPSVTLSVPDEVMLGESLAFSVTFDNSTDTGFGPYIDLFLPATGTDGGGDPDGITLTSATYLGATLTATTLSLTGPGVNHPYARTNTGAPLVVTPPSGFRAGDQLVVLQLPFGSFTPGQTPAQVSVTAAVSNKADVGAVHTIAARGGFRYGNDALDNPTSDPSIFGALVTDTVTPTLLKLRKTYIGPEDETSTGPNFPRQYRVTVDVASGQQVDLLSLRDVLPTTLQYLSLDQTLVHGAAVSTTDIATPLGGTPGGTLERRYPTVTGTAAANDVEMVFSFYVPYAQGTTPIIDPSTGNDVTSVNDASAAGKWLPTDTRDRGPGGAQVDVSANATTNDHTLNDRSIATQKSVTVVTDTGAMGPTPGDTLQYMIAVQVSDFFAFQNVVLTDVISDGQRYDTTFTPTLQVNGNGYVLATAGLNNTNVTVTPNYTPDSAPPNDGTTAIAFRISDEIVTRGQTNGKLIGGCLPTTGVGSGTPSCSTFNDGPTSATIVFRAVIQNVFTDTFLPGDQAVDHNDVLSDTITVSGDILSTTDVTTTTGQAEEDVSSASVTIVEGITSKSIYKINGQDPGAAPYRVGAGDVVTYRMRYTLPASSTENLKLTDYLPLPIFDVSSMTTTFSTTIDNTAPPTGQSKFGPAETFFPISNRTPTVTTSTTDNFVRFNFGTFDDPQNRASEVDVLMSIAVSNAVFADGLFLTNQVTVEENNTVQEINQDNAIIQVQITEPVLGIRKGAVATNRTSATFSPGTAGPVTFNAPGTSGNRWTGTISSNGLAASPINSNLSGVDADDLVTFAIVVENTGSGIYGAYDVRIKDTLPTGFAVPGGGLNLRVADGTGAAMPFTTLGTGLFDPSGGIEIDDPGPTANPAGGLDTAHATSGRNIAVITYDLQVQGSVTPGQQLTNTATLFNYASAEGGPDFTPADLTDAATVTVSTTSTTKQVQLTSETTTTGSNVAIGETVTYRVVVTVPEATLTNARLVDSLPAGLIVKDIQNVTPSSNALSTSIGSFPTVLSNAQTALTNAGTGTSVNFDFGTLTNTDTDNASAETITIDYRVVVLNVNGNNRGTVRTNSVRFTSNGSPDATSSTPVTIVEPGLQVAKSASPSSNLDAGDTVTYSITVSHPTVSNADAFEVSLSDTVPSSLTVTGVSHTAGRAPDSGTLNHVGNVVSATWATLPKTTAPTSSTIQITATVNGTVTPGQTIGNTATVTWSSLPGDVTGAQSPFSSVATERTGNTSNPGGNENGYTASGSVNIAVRATSSSKQPTASSEAFTTGNTVAIGEVVTYQVTVTVPETTLPGAQLVDTLPTGLAFVALDSLVPSPSITTSNPNGFTGSPSSVLETAQAALTAGVATLNFGTLTNSDTNNATNETIVLTYRVVVLNHTSNVRGQTRTNSASFTSTGSPAANASATAQTIVEPAIQVGKTVSPSTPVDAGDTVTYTLTITNGSPSNTTAFDVVVTDVVPAALTLGSATHQSGVAPNSPNGITTSSNTVTVRYDALAVGETSVIQITASVPGTVNSGQTITNTATVVWTSLPVDSPHTPASPLSTISTERTGSTSDPGGSANTYAATSPGASVTIRSSQAGKLVTLTSESTTQNVNVAVGEIVTYQVTVTVPEGTIPGGRIRDTLPVGLAIADLDSLTSSPSISVADTGGPTTLGAVLTAARAALTHPGTAIDVQLGTITNSNTDNSVAETIVLTYRAVVLNVAGNDRGTSLTNSAQFSSTGNSDVTATAGPLTIVEPTLQIGKSVSPTSAVDAGDTLTYTLNISHSGPSNADAFDVVITDALPATVTYQSASRTAGVTPTSITQSSGTVTVAYDQFAHGQTSTIEIVVKVNVTATAGQTISNTANMAWTSLPIDGTTPLTSYFTAGANASATERTGNTTNPGGNQNDYSTASPAATVTVRGSQAAKDVQLTSQAFTSGNSVAIGEKVTYAVTITVPEGTIPGAELVDTLPAGLAYVSLDALSASPSLSVAGGFPAVLNTARTNLTASQARFTFGTITNSDETNATPETIVATYTVVVLNEAANVRGQTRTNSASFTSTGQTAITSSAAPLTIVEPKLRLVKTVAPANPRVGDAITYTIVIDHESPPSNTDAYNAVITDVLPAAVTYVSATSTAGQTPTSLTHAAGTVTATFDEFLAGATSTIRIVGTVNSTTGAGQLVTNPARVRWTSLPGDVTAPQSTKSAVSTERTGDTANPGAAANTYETTGSAQVTVGAEHPAVGLAKSAGTVTNNGDGSFTVPFTFTVKNLGDVSLTGVQVTDNLAATFTGATSYTVVGGSVSATGSLSANTAFTGNAPNTGLLGPSSTLAPSGTETVTFNVRVVPGANLGPYSNSATASGVSPDLATVTDISDNGTNPDTNNNNNANEAGENDPTPVSFTERPAIGIAKSLGSIVNNFDGTYTATFTFAVANLGDVPLSSVQVTDDLAAAFTGATGFAVVSGSVSTTGTLSANTGFTGTGAGRSLLNAGSSTLAVNASHTVSFSVRVTPGTNLGPYTNQAIATAIGPAGQNVSDSSDNGTNPDTDGDRNGDETGENDPTPISFVAMPAIGVAKSIGTVVNHGDGTFTVPFTLTVKNLGDLNLANVQVSDNLSTAFAGATSFQLVTGSLSASGTLSAGTAFTGTGANTALLTAASSTLPRGATETIQFSVRVTPGANLGPYNNSATASARAANGADVTDTSDNGTNPDPDGDNNGNEPGENDPTPVSFSQRPAVGLAKSVGTVTNNGDGTFTVPFTLTVKNLGDVALSGIQVNDDLAVTFAGATAYAVIPGSLAATGTLTTSPSFTGTAGNPGLLNASASTLPVGATQTTTFRVRVTPGANLGPYSNQATATGTAPSGQTVTDRSDNGTNPDTDGDGNGDETGENDPTPVSFTERPALGIAKRVANVVNNGDGSFVVTYAFTVRNLGDVPVRNIQIVDNFGTSFAGARRWALVPGTETVTGSLVINPHIGNGASASMVDPTQSRLAPGESGTVTCQIQIWPGSNLGPYRNFATASGVGPSGAAVSDVSDDGTNPDTDADGNPDEPGENDPTPLVLVERPVIGVAKSVGALTDNGDGSFNVPYTLTVRNLGNVTLTSVQVTDDLTAAFRSPARFSIVPGALSASGGLTINPGFKGAAPDAGLLQPASSTLAVNETQTIRFTVRVAPGTAPGPYQNSATASGVSPAGASVSDVSDNGTTSDADSDGDPTEVGENDPTPVVFVVDADVEIKKTASSGQVLNGDTLTYTLEVINHGPIGTAGVKVVDVLPAELEVTKVTTSYGTCAQGKPRVTCDLGTMHQGQRAVITITTTVGRAGETIVNTASVQADQRDTNPSNNQDSVRTRVSYFEESRPKQPKLTEEERQQEQRTNRHGLDDYRTEGNAVRAVCDDDRREPRVGDFTRYATIATRDGEQRLNLLYDTRYQCERIREGDYLEADGVKQHEALFDAENLTIRRGGKVVK